MYTFLRLLNYAIDYLRTASLFNYALRIDANLKTDAVVVLIHRLEFRSGGLRNIARIVNSLSRSYNLPLLIYVQNTSISDSEIFKEYEFEGVLIDKLPKEANQVVTSSWVFCSQISEYIISSKGKWTHIIQDYDELFFPVSTRYFIAAMVKSEPDSFIASGKWMRLKKNTIYLPFPIDKKIYNVVAESSNRDIDVLFFHKPEMPRRCANLCELIAERLLELKPDLKIGFYGSKISKWLVKANVTHFGAVPSLIELANLYQRSRVGISVNLTNPSLIPFEQASCGCYPLSPYIDNYYPEFELPFIHVSGTVDDFCKHIICELEEKKSVLKSKELIDYYLKKNLICNLDSFPLFINEAIQNQIL